ncbi:zinc ribbon domain-containing protein [Bacillus sp. S14(2024)]|uniref:zinc ribbon domain-containing protein n=1 Tax=Bacillus sp. S14(2024) TaxID=3162884 RepID=UPI003D19296F
MKFCKECGEKIADQLRFCSNCGAKVEVQEQVKLEKEVQPKKSKKNIVLVVVCAVIVALLFGAYQFGAYTFSKEKQVRAFLQALDKKDAKELEPFIKMSDASVKVTQDDIKSYLGYMKENPSYYQQLVSYLNKQTVDQELVKDKAEFPDVQVVEDGKEWLLYPKYKLQVQSYYMRVQTNKKDTDVYVNDKKAAKVTNEKLEKEVGPYFPGVYRVKAVAKTDLTTLESEKEVELAGEKDGKVKVELPLEGNYVTIESDENDATVYVNGKKRGTLNKGSYKLGPVPTDETIEIHLEKKFDWGTAKTESVKIGENSSYYLPFPKQTSESEVGEFVRTHIYNNVRAIALNDFSLIEGDYDKSGKSYKEDRDYLAYLQKKGIKEDLLRFEVRNVERISSTQYKVTSYEEYNIHYGDGSVKFKSFSNEHIITVTPEGKLLYHSIGANNTLKSEQISGPTETRD